MTRTTSPWCNSSDWKAETIVGLFVWSPELIPGIALLLSSVDSRSFGDGEVGTVVTHARLPIG
jgi:hypothetical protein